MIHWNYAKLIFAMGAVPVSAPTPIVTQHTTTSPTKIVDIAKSAGIILLYLLWF
jgi:hypothetical protein